MTDAHIQARPGFQIKGWHVLAAMLLFFGGDIVVNTLFMVDAYKTYPGESSLTPYEDGLAYNAALQQRQAQAALGWRISAGSVGDQGLQVQVVDKAGAPLRGLRVSGELQRPATEAGSRTVALQETAPGVYTAVAAGLHGAWDLNVTALDGQGRKALADRRLILP